MTICRPDSTNGRDPQKYDPEKSAHSPELTIEGGHVKAKIGRNLKICVTAKPVQDFGELTYFEGKLEELLGSDFTKQSIQASQLLQPSMVDAAEINGELAALLKGVAAFAADIDLLRIEQQLMQVQLQDDRSEYELRSGRFRSSGLPGMP